MFKRLLGLLLLLSLALLAGAVLHTLTLSYGRPEARPPDPLSFDTSMAIERFAGAIRIPTVSQPEQAPDLAALKEEFKAGVRQMNARGQRGTSDPRHRRDVFAHRSRRSTRSSRTAAPCPRS